MDNKFNSFFKGKTILVTGHTGFKGSWLSIWLNYLGANVIGYALDPVHNYQNFVISQISKHIIDIRKDIRDYESLKSVFKKYQPELVFHLAAQPLVSKGFEDPKETYETNIMGTINIFECVKELNSTKAIINITSDKCYENQELDRGYTESDPMGGYDPYSSSKGCSELITASYRNSFFNEKEIALASVRAGNVIGGGDWSEKRIIPDCVRSLEQNNPILIRNPKAIRPWQLVLEPLSGYLQLAVKMVENPKYFSSAWNFGPSKNSTIAVEELVQLCIKYYGKGSWELVPTTFHETKTLTLDSSKAIKEIGWKPLLNINDTVQFTIDWYKNYKQQTNMHEFCIDQIKKYSSLLNK